MSVDALLKALADGSYHSGQDLADRQGVSRTAIWKQVATLAGLGLEVERRRGLGYRIPGGLDLLDRQAIAAALDSRVAARVHELQVYREIDSTNRVLSDGDPPPGGLARVALAERQTSGRGRRGKVWLSPFARNIYLSFDWQFSGGVQEIEGLSLAIGVAVCEALAAQGVKGLELKWPNDVLHGGRKIGGILIELAGDAEGPCRAIVGIGINVSMPEEAARAIDQPWTDLATVCAGEVPPRSAIAAGLINHCLPLLAEYSRAGFADWRARWLALDAFANAPVTVLRGRAKTGGVARGVDERGALLLETAQGVSPVAGGELSLRGAGRR
jgi:BirA family biotin operon repressor/biotin-[acetyl-CoA-carboxylase] ligase